MVEVTTFKVIGNVTFIHLKMSTQPIKIAKEKDE
jgi:hypothetical protein